MSRATSYRSPRAQRVAALLVISVVVAGGIVLAAGTLGGESGQNLAHVWVDTDGGSCTRAAAPIEYDPAAACGSFGVAYDAANASRAASVIRVKGGTYGDQAITGNRSSTNRVAIEPASGESVQLAGKLRLGDQAATTGPDYLTIRGIETAPVGPGYETPENRWGIYLLPGATHIEFVGIRAGNVAIFGATDVTVEASELGPCRASTLDSIPGTGPCTINYVDFGETIRPERITYDGVHFHGYTYAASCVAAGNCHYRPLYMNGVKGAMIRNSTFAEHVFEPWFTISGPDAGAVGNRDILIENNQFGTNVQAGAGHGLSLAWCENYTGGDASYGNVTIRFNSFARGVDLAVPGADNANGEQACVLTNFRVYGNIFGAKHPSCGLAAVQWSYNVFAGSNSGTCGTGDVSIGGTTMPFYLNDTLTPSANDDYQLTGAEFPADNLVPTTAGCPDADRRGVRRPQNTNCDAGAHERDLD